MYIYSPGLSIRQLNNERLYCLVKISYNSMLSMTTDYDAQWIFNPYEHYSCSLSSGWVFYYLLVPPHTAAPMSIVMNTGLICCILKSPVSNFSSMATT